MRAEDKEKLLRKVICKRLCTQSKVLTAAFFYDTPNDANVLHPEHSRFPALGELSTKGDCNDVFLGVARKETVLVAALY